MKMRSHRKVLSLILALALTAGLLSMSAAAVSFTDGDKIVHTQAVSTLVELGVLSGKTDGSFDPAAPVTRAEMCKIISTLLNGGRVPELEPRTQYNFTDVSAHWAKLLIEYCNALGIVGGRGDGSFDPDGSVTARECSKMLLIAAGYEADKEGFTGAGWADAVDKLAKAQGLYTGLDSGKAGEAVSRDEAAQMVFNVLSVEVVNYYQWIDEKITEVPRYEVGENFLSAKFNKEFKNGALVDIVRPEPSYEPIVLPS